MFHQLYLKCLIFMYINVSPVILVVLDIHVYQCFISYTCSVRYCAMCFFYKEIVLLFAMHLLYADIKLTKIICVIYLQWLLSVKKDK